MSLNENIRWLEEKPLNRGGKSDEEKLKASFEYREREPKELTQDELGTAEHRPRHGLIYDAPLGLKF